MATMAETIRRTGFHLQKAADSAAVPADGMPDGDLRHGNGWLDWCCEQSSEFFWRKEDVNWLTTEFKDARKKLDQVAKLDKWLETSTAERMTQAVHLWNRAINQAKKHGKQKPQSDGIRIRTLAEIL
jgi:hypothetical protein